MLFFIDIIFVWTGLTTDFWEGESMGVVIRFYEMIQNPGSSHNIQKYL